MNSFGHILKKDLRRYAWAWVTLAVLALAKIYLFGTTEGLMDNSLNTLLTYVSSMAGGILAFFLVVMVVQEETLCDPEAYWLARPVVRWQLLAGKLCFVLLVVIGISVATEALVIMMNSGASRLGYVLAGIFPALAIWSWQVFLAAQTKSLPHYLLLLVLLVVGFYVISLGLAYVASDWSGDFFLFDMGVLPQDIPDEIVSLIQTLLWLIGIIVILTVYYLRRQRYIAWLAALPFVFLSFVLSKGDLFMGDRVDFSNDIEMKPLFIESSGTRFTNGQKYTQYSAVIELTNTLDYDVWGHVSDVELTSGGEAIPIRTSMTTMMLEKIEGEEDLFKIELGSILSQDVKKLKETVGMDLSLEIKLSTQRRIGALPLQEGVGMAYLGNRFAIQSYFRSTEEISLDLAGYIPKLSFESAPTPAYYEPFRGLFSFGFQHNPTGIIVSGNLNNSFNVFEGGIEEGQVKTPMPEDADLSDYTLIVYARVIDSREWVFANDESVEVR